MFELFFTVFQGFSVLKLVFDPERALKVFKHVVYDRFAQLVLPDFLLSEHLVDLILHLVGNALFLDKLQVLLWTEYEVMFLEVELRLV